MTSISTRVKAFLRQRGLFVFRTLPRGVDVTYDLRRALPNERYAVICDVGANTGQSAALFLTSFPEATVLCFEPSVRLHALLARRFASHPRVVCENLALGSAEATGTLRHTADPTMYHLSPLNINSSPELRSSSFETVTITTLDGYCDRAGVSEIDFLKIDTEGHDLDVLRGGSRLLGAGAVGLIQCECGMSPDNSFHCAFEDIKATLEGFGYRIFGLYEQVEEFPTGVAQLRRVNAVFASHQVLERNRLAPPEPSAVPTRRDPCRP